MNQHRIETDLLVAGGGMSGVCAALAAARQGIRVVLIQDRSVLGGNASSEIRMHIVGADCHGSRKGWRESGLIEELKIEDAFRNPARCFPLWDVILYEKVMNEPNITLLLDTDVVGVETSVPDTWSLNRPVRSERMYEFTGPRGVRITSARAVRNLTEDEFIISAKFYADCTGDGRLGFEAGADFRIGREANALHGETIANDVDDVQTLGNSIMFTSKRHDQPVPFVAPPWARKFTPDQLKVGRGIRSWEYGFWWIEWGGTLDTIKDNLTTIRHELYGIALGLWDYVKNSGTYPDSANWALDWIGAIPGKRESRRFIGQHVLTQHDVQQAPVHTDEVAFGGWAIDLHPPKGIDAVDEPPFTPHHVENVFGIPLRCYYSRNVENLFFAGRNISATHVAFASTRVMATCSVGGEAVGFAAARCVKDGLKSPQQIVDDARLLSRLHDDMLNNDVTLLSRAPTGTADLIRHATIGSTSTAPGFHVDAVRDGRTRDELNPKTAELVKSHGWRSVPIAQGVPVSLDFSWTSPVAVRELHLWFDTGFSRELVLSPADGPYNRQGGSRVLRGPQPETVKDYDLLINGDVAVHVTGNYQRKVVHRFDRTVDVRSLQLRVHTTNGLPEARIFEVRAF